MKDEHFLSQRWTGAVHFSEKVRQYPISTFDFGEQSGSKEDPREVSQDMRKAKGETGSVSFLGKSG